MLEFLTSAWESITSTIEFLVNIITSLVRFIALIPSYVNYLNDLMFWLPVPFSVFMGIGITITVVLVVINRVGS